MAAALIGSAGVAAAAVAAGVAARRLPSLPAGTGSNVAIIASAAAGGGIVAYALVSASRLATVPADRPMRVRH
eukprot:6413420-Prymnesium_polylepis.1